MAVTRTSLVDFFVLGVIAIALPLTIFFTQQQQQTQQHAASLNTHVPVGISPGFGFEDPFNKMSSSQQQVVISQMKSDGVQWVRLDYSSNSTFDYQFAKDAETAGIDVDVILEDNGYTKAVTTLKPIGVHTYEILNEVNYHMSAAQYTATLKTAYIAIKAVDPSATVLMSGLGTGPGSQEPYTYLQAMYAAGAKGYFDAANMHPYSFPDNPTQTSDAWNPWSYLPQMHTIMVNNGEGNKKIWLTEFGCPTGANPILPNACTDATFAQQITQAYNQASAWGWAGPLFIFSWEDNTTDGDFGLYYSNGSPKTVALGAFRQAAFSSQLTATPTLAITTTSVISAPPLSPTSEPTNNPSGATFSLTLCPHGLGNCGDNANPSSGGNTNPLHTSRNVTLTISDTNNSQVAQQQGQVSYTSQAQNFQGTIPVSNLPRGNYIISIKMDGFLGKLVPGIVSMTQGQVVNLASISLVNGDMNNDNQLDIQDYNVLLSCFGSKFTTPTCLTPATSLSPGADIDDDGTVGGADYNLFLRELSVQRGG